MTDLPEIFGSLVFNEAVMKERLPEYAYNAMIRTIDDGYPLDRAVVSAVAAAIKDWAIEKGATHYTHWFQPLTGVTAEKHDSFISPNPDGTIITAFSENSLMQGEPDASSFPSGGLRATFEARGYTAWDPTSYAFIKDNTLCIPTAFCSYGGEALDEKTPLLRSMKALNTQALRILKLFGSDATYVYPNAGVEQEYFLIDRASYNARKDLIYTGRTLFGNRPPKGQELDDHYFGRIKLRISKYMHELDEELWKMGVYASTEHNEAAPAQHELAPVFTRSNLSCDHNQLIMETMRKVAKKNNLACLLHEKPFAGINGSGKHNNWSLSTNTGVNLLNPGKTPWENAQFLIFFCAVIAAVDDYQELLRISVASASNDNRLGGFEAPPAIISIFIGSELESVLSAIESGDDYSASAACAIDIGVDSLPTIPRDSTDRNRTSPFAFTGNKFEFRMPGSSASVAGPNAVINSIVADKLMEFADELEAAPNLDDALDTLIRRVIREHKNILFSGNGYDESWAVEAKKRGLLNLASTADAIPHLLDDKNVAMFRRCGVFSRRELEARCDILLESYCKNIAIEARTMLEMSKTDILPAVFAYSRELSDTIISKNAAMSGISCSAEQAILMKLSMLSDETYRRTAALESAVENAQIASLTAEKRAQYYKTTVLPAMAALRESVDAMEPLVSEKLWPFPSYGAILYTV